MLEDLYERLEALQKWANKIDMQIAQILEKENQHESSEDISE